MVASSGTHETAYCGRVPTVCQGRAPGSRRETRTCNVSSSALALVLRAHGILTPASLLPPSLFLYLALFPVPFSIFPAPLARLPPSSLFAVSSRYSRNSNALGRLAALASAPPASSSPALSPSPSPLYKPSQYNLNTAEKARTVTSATYSGTLCTTVTASSATTSNINGAPFGSYVDYVLDDSGFPILLLHEKSLHTTFIRSSSSPAALVTLFTQRAALVASQSAHRCSLTGPISVVSRDAPDYDVISERFSAVHSYARQVAASPSFSYHRLTPSAIYFVSGFGVSASWVDVGEYASSAPDLLAPFASSLIASMNGPENDEDRLSVAAHVLQIQGLVTDASATSIDRLGVDFRVTYQRSAAAPPHADRAGGGGAQNKASDGPTATAATATTTSRAMTDEFRIGFRSPVESVENAKSEVLKIFQEAWERGQGEEEYEEDLEPLPVFKSGVDSL